MVNEVTFVG